jgi:hypothetical protein
MADRKTHYKSRILPAIWGIWMIAALFGDEIAAVVMFGAESDALLMSFTQRWWWIYQGVLLVLASLVSLVAKGIARRAG